MLPPMPRFSTIPTSTRSDRGTARWSRARLRATGRVIPSVAANERGNAACLIASRKSGFKLKLANGVPVACPVPPPPGCTDGVQNGTETGVDCGGDTCPACPSGGQCTAPEDCASGICVAGVCHDPTCTDGIEDGTESDVDCGGGACAVCGDGAGCRLGADCASLVCTLAVCQQATCADGVRNGGEVADLEPACDSGAECPSGVCSANVCQPASCTDGVENGAETALDCGGGSCPGCPIGAACFLNPDCAVGGCSGGVCQPPCTAGAECPSGVCATGYCRAPNCADGARNGSETDVDCGGGACPGCALGKQCSAAGDCASNSCGSTARCTCGDQLFTFPVNSNDGGSVDPAEWPGGTATQNGPSGCSVTINRPSNNVDLVCTLAAPFSVNGFAGYSSCGGTGGEDGDGCQPVSCPPAGVGSCCGGRPSCSAALNGSATARYFVQCQP